MSNIDKQAREQLEAAERRMAEQSAIVAAAEKLVRCKGRYHSELNYRALAKLFGVITPDLPPLEHENVQCADAAEGFRIALASLESMTPEERVKHDASTEAFKEMLPQTAPVDKEFIPKNLDKALGVVGVALPESKEEFNFQIERWIQRLIDRVIRYADEFKEQPAPVIPDGWISCSERMPAQDDWVLIYSQYGEYLAGQVQGKYVELNDGTLSWLGAALHWMPLPAAPEPDQS